MKNINRFIATESTKYMNRYMTEKTVDLTVTSPPYDSLRNYNGYVFDAERMRYTDLVS